MAARSRLHKARVAAKRLRALWRLARPALGEVEVRRRARRLAAAARPLSAARDAEAVRALARRLNLRAPEPAPRPAAAALARLERELAASRAAFDAAAPARLARGLKRGRRRLRAAAAAARAASDAALLPCLHECRKRAKDLQYQLEHLERGGSELARVKRAARELGDARDRRRLAALLPDAGAALLASAARLEERALRRLRG